MFTEPPATSPVPHKPRSCRDKQNTIPSSRSWQSGELPSKHGSPENDPSSTSLTVSPLDILIGSHVAVRANTAHVLPVAAFSLASVCVDRTVFGKSCWCRNTKASPGTRMHWVSYGHTASAGSSSWYLTPNPMGLLKSFHFNVPSELNKSNEALRMLVFRPTSGWC